MRLKNLLKRMLLIVAHSGLAIFVALLLSLIPINSTPGNSAMLVENAFAQSNQEQVKQTEINIGSPVLLKIPVIGVDSVVIPMGITPDGEMKVPEILTDVAWFNLGPHPGENGSAVIAGHYSEKKNTPAVFDNLHKLSAGDKISIEDEKGITTTFIVREIKTYDKNEATPEVFKSNDNKAHLNLITCTGLWNKIEKTFSKRLIVFADKE